MKIYFALFLIFTLLALVSFGAAAEDTALTPGMDDGGFYSVCRK